MASDGPKWIEQVGAQLGGDAPQRLEATVGQLGHRGEALVELGAFVGELAAQPHQIELERGDVVDQLVVDLAARSSCAPLRAPPEDERRDRAPGAASGAATGPRACARRRRAVGTPRRSSSPPGRRWDRPPARTSAGRSRAPRRGRAYRSCGCGLDEGGPRPRAAGAPSRRRARPRARENGRAKRSCVATLARTIRSSGPTMIIASRVVSTVVRHSVAMVESCSREMLAARRRWCRLGVARLGDGSAPSTARTLRSSSAWLGPLAQRAVERRRSVLLSRRPTMGRRSTT